MTRLNTIFVAIGATTGAAILAGTALSTAQAQSGHSLVLAEQACLDRGIAPYTGAFNNCVVRTASALDGPSINYRVVPEPRLNPNVGQTYRVRPVPSDPSYFEEYVVPSRVTYRY